eukprot:scaffold9726_cov119-Isochrysis_galbana.AAC.39
MEVAVAESARPPLPQLCRPHRPPQGWIAQACRCQRPLRGPAWPCRRRGGCCCPLRHRHLSLGRHRCSPRRPCSDRYGTAHCPVSRGWTIAPAPRPGRHGASGWYPRSAGRRAHACVSEGSRGRWRASMGVSHGNSRYSVGPRWTGPPGGGGVGSATPIAGPHARLTGKAARGWGRGGGVRLAPARCMSTPTTGVFRTCKFLTSLPASDEKKREPRPLGRGSEGAAALAPAQLRSLCSRNRTSLRSVAAFSSYEPSCSADCGETRRRTRSSSTRVGSVPSFDHGMCSSTRPIMPACTTSGRPSSTCSALG